MSSPSGRGRRPTADSAAYSLVERIDAAARDGPSADTVPTGFPSLDRILGGGFRRRDLILLAGDVASGKSALALAIAIRSARLGASTILFSGEMTEERLAERSVALEGRASIDELRAGKLSEVSRAAVGAAALRLRDLPLDLPSPPGQRLLRDRRRAGRPAAAGAGGGGFPPDRRGSPSGATPEDTHAGAIRALKGLALSADAAILVLTRLNANPAQRPDPRPSLDDLGGGGALKQHADLVLQIYREEMYRPGGGVEGATELVVAKNRNGPTASVDLYFYRKWLRFEDLLDT